MYASDIKHPTPTLQDKLHRLYMLNRHKAIDLSFRPPFLNLLERLGNPHLNLPPVIHVAGTNGKGSTIAMLRSILEAAGYKVHAYTSPHLMTFNERIVLAGSPIEDAPLEALIDEALELNANAELTFFEITTAIGFAAFSRTPADICLLEVGMGGRLDCTNVIEKPLITLISAIGMDHMEHLGETIKAIAAEKAGIMKPDVPCVIGHQAYEETHTVFENIAAQHGCRLFYVTSQDSTPETALIGPHQSANLTGALRVLECIESDFPINENHIREGLKTVRWPARLQSLNPADFGLNTAWQLFLDGGHNPGAGFALARQAEIWAAQDTAELHIVCAMMKGKDSANFLKPLIPHAASVSFTTIEGEPLSQSAAELQKIYPQAKAYSTYQSALEQLNTNHKQGRVLICGSLYLAGHVLKACTK